MHLTLWYVVLVFHQCDVCTTSVGSGYSGLRERRLCVFRKLCPVDFLKLMKFRRFCCSLWACCMLRVVMMGKWSNDSAC